MHTKKMTASGSRTEELRKSVEYDKCRDWALELHGRKLQKCEEFTSREQMPYLVAVSNRIKDEQKPRRSTGIEAMPMRHGNPTMTGMIIKG